MISIKVSGSEHVKELAETLKLPNWLVEAVIIEYLPRRRFLEAGASMLFDFESVTQQDVESVENPYILLGGVTLYHNVTSEVLRTRITHGMVGLPVSTLAEHPHLSIPEGKASPSYIPIIFNPITVFDWKLNLSQYAIIYDRKTKEIFQWNLVTLPTETSKSYEAALMGYNPEIFTVDQFREMQAIRENIFQIFSEYNEATDEKYLVSVREILESRYQELEKLWVSMRQAVFAYHELNKRKPEARRGYTEDPPPILTVFDQFDLSKNEVDTSRKSTFRVRTYIEPLFYRAAFRTSEKATKMKAKINGDRGTSTLIAEEIEASAESIILSAMCLEAYINGFIEDHIDKARDIVKSMEFRAKWLFVPAILGKPDCFNAAHQPFQKFDKLTKWRNNDLVHYKHEFHKPVLLGNLGSVSKIYSICNAENSRLAVQTVREMVIRINEYLGFPIPDWVQGTTSFSSIWLNQTEYTDKDYVRITDRSIFDKFTDQAREAMRLAGEEAKRLQHNYIGTEHLLLGLILAGEGVAIQVLSSLGVELDKLRAAVELIIWQDDRIIHGEFSIAPRYIKVINLAVEEARHLNHHYIGTEHLLLGLLREGEGITAGVLESLGITLEKARSQTVFILKMK